MALGAGDEDQPVALVDGDADRVVGDDQRVADLPVGEGHDADGVCTLVGDEGQRSSVRRVHADADQQ